MADLKGLLPNPFPRTMGPNCMKYLQEVVDSGLTCDMITRFERAFAEAYGVKHCIATPGCTPALAVLAAAFGFEPGDEIIVSPITDYGTLLGILSENYIPVFADTEPGTVNISAATIEPCITDRTRAILVVHKTGLICDMDPINELAQERGLIVYEDACQAVFGEYKGRLAGNLSTAGGFLLRLREDDGLGRRRMHHHQRRRPGGAGAVHRPESRRGAGAGLTGASTPCGATPTACRTARRRSRSRSWRSSGRRSTHRDKMVRLLTDLIGEIPGVTPLPIPDYVGVYSCWMFGMSIDPTVFKCISG